LGGAFVQGAPDGGVPVSSTPSFEDAAADPIGTCGVHCSNDLHDVVDCNGHVLKTCTADQGCAAGGCVSACDSANANKSTIGCEYYSVDTDTDASMHGSCFVAFVANTWTSPVAIAVDYDGETLDLTKFGRIATGSGANISYLPIPSGGLPPGEVALLFLAEHVPSVTYFDALCPAGVEPGYNASDAATHGTGFGRAFHITTSAPTVAYDMLPYGGGSAAYTGATLLLPTSAWDRNYVAVSAYPQRTYAAYGRPSMNIVAQEDGTTITILPNVTIEPGGGVAKAMVNVPHTYGPLARGQVLQFTQSEELTGSPVQSNKPIGLWGSATCMTVPSADKYCDSAHQQIPPVQALGSEYVAVRYRNRGDSGPEETPPWRFVGVVDGTKLTYDPGPPPGAPT
jgi:hypothetical protein